MKVVWFGELSPGSTAEHRARAFARLPGVQLIRASYCGKLSGWLQRAAWKLGRPSDPSGANDLLLETVAAHRPDAVVVDGCRVLRPATLERVRSTGALLAHYSGDDVLAPHNVNAWVRGSLRHWDVFFTTKTFNVPELRERGVRRVVLLPNAFCPDVHRPLSPQEVGDEYEAFDLVFVGSFERQRAESLRKLRAAGFSILVQGDDPSRIGGSWAELRRDGIEVRPQAHDLEYSKAMHRGKVALGFLRKINRDRITQRSIEIPAMARPLLAERTEEHDGAFVPGVEYFGFRGAAEMISGARRLIEDPELRARIAADGHRRCLGSGFATDEVAAQIAGHLQPLRACA